MPTGDPIVQDRLGLHRETEVVGEACDLRVFHPGLGLELEGRDHRAGMNLHDRAFDRELAALLLQQPRAVHQLALVDFAFRLRRVQESEGRQGVVPFAALRRRLRRRLRIR